jgi:hypothetical protein
MGRSGTLARDLVPQLDHGKIPLSLVVDRYPQVASSRSTSTRWRSSPDGAAIGVG